MKNLIFRQSQYETVYWEFFKKPQTMKMLSIRTNIDRANICWYCRELRKAKKLVAIKKDTCWVTRHKATYWTTNPALSPGSCQLKIFN